MNHQSTSDRTDDIARKAASKVSEAAEQVHNTAAEQLDRLERVIRRNPVASVSAAAGIGLLLAMIARR